MKKIKLIYHKEINGVLTTVELHTNWPVAYGNIRAHACSRCSSKMKVGDKTVEIEQIDMKLKSAKTIDYYCSKCANL
jgi:hypothetical protein